MTFHWHFSFLLPENNEVYSVGSNLFFQLGWGEIGQNYSMPGKIEKLVGLEILQISCSDYFSMAVISGKFMLVF